MFCGVGDALDGATYLIWMARNHTQYHDLKVGLV